MPKSRKRKKGARAKKIKDPIARRMAQIAKNAKRQSFYDPAVKPVPRRAPT